MRDYTKTGKRVKSLVDGCIDLTYNRIYDVFRDNDGDIFIVDDADEIHYISIDKPNFYELVGDVVEATNNIKDTDETKLKFKVGDTESNYTKTGKKVMCINSNRRDLTYKKVYDVFTNQDSVDFIIDDVGDKRYESLEFPYWCEKSDGMVDKANETKPNFKVGDKVKVVNNYYISQFVDVINVGDTDVTGVIISIDDNDNITPYLVKFEDSNVRENWWFTDKCIELVEDNTDTIENDHAENTPIKSDGSQIVSDGGSSSYYAQQIPKGMLERFNTTGIIEAKDVIRLFLGNDFNMGNIFKAYCRIISLRNGKGKAGIDEQYDLTKAKYFTEDELNFYLENKNV